MAEYSEVIKQFKRMCKSVAPAKCTRGECPMGCENIGQCRKIAFEQPSCFEDIVMAWAEEHPETIYPTWVEWLHDNGIVLDARQHDEIEHWVLGLEAINPIPADIAQRLGLQPKEAKE